jgi:hypothetical protein
MRAEDEVGHMVGREIVAVIGRLESGGWWVAGDLMSGESVLEMTRRDPRVTIEGDKLLYTGTIRDPGDGP